MSGRCSRIKRGRWPLTMTVPPLPRIMIEDQVRAALLEDLGRAGDITTDAIIPAERDGEDRAGRAQSPASSPASMSRCWPSR